jgi:hypothetical protein
MPIIWQFFRDDILRLDVDTAARLENVILRETLNDQQFMRRLETSLRDAFRSLPTDPTPWKGN